MTAIELTEEHKEKLLEMCKELFPEFLIDEDTYFDENGILSTNLRIKEDSYIGYEIHWFEFCMTHLREKLNLHHDDMFCTMNPGKNSFKHPIEYLYNGLVQKKLLNI